MIKNTAGQKVGVQMVNATTGAAFTGSVTVAVTVDAGTQATGSVGSGACTHEGNGYHTYAPAQAETNGDLIAFTFTGTGAVPQTVQVYTRAATPDVNVTTIEGSDATDQIRDAVVDDATRIDASALNTASVTTVPGINTKIGTPSDLGGGASLAANLADIESQTDDIGVAGAGLTEAGGTGDHLSAVPDTSGTTTLLDRLTATRAGYLDNLSAGAVATAAKLLSYFQSALRKDVTVDADIGGNYDDATDSQEAIRDRGDSAWTTAVGFATHSAADVWAVATRLLTAGTNIVLAKGTGVTGFNDPSAEAIVDEWESQSQADPTGFHVNLMEWQGVAPNPIDSGRVIAQIGSAETGSLSDDALASDFFDKVRGADSDTLETLSDQLDGKASQTSVDDLPTNSELATALTNLDAAVSTRATPAQVNEQVVDVMRTDTIPDSIAADGSQPTIAQALYEILQFLEERSVSGTTMTIRKRDGSTSLMTFTLDDGSDPTSQTRAS